MSTERIIPERITVRGIAEKVVAVFAQEPFKLKNGRYQIVFAALTEVGQWTRTALTSFDGVIWMTSFEGDKIDWRFLSFAEMGETLQHRRDWMRANGYTEICFRHETD